MQRLESLLQFLLLYFLLPCLLAQSSTQSTGGREMAVFAYLPEWRYEGEEMALLPSNWPASYGLAANTLTCMTNKTL